MKIAIDIGHANNTGARGQGYEEHAIVTAIADHLYSGLRMQGYDVNIIDFPSLTNKQDLNKTIQEANKSHYDMGISLHCDSASYMVESKGEDGPRHEEIPDPIPRGAHVCYYPTSKKGKKLAEHIASHLCRLLPGRADQIKARSDLAILRKTTPAWVLCECGFITNPNDAYGMKHHPESIANAIARGVESYVFGD